MATDGYFLSMDELLLLSTMLEQPLAICIKEGDAMRCECTNVRAADTDMLWLGLTIGHGHRGHFCRLLFAEGAEYTEACRVIKDRTARLEAERRGVANQHRMHLGTGSVAEQEGAAGAVTETTTMPRRGPAQ